MIEKTARYLLIELVFEAMAASFCSVLFCYLINFIDIILSDLFYYNLHTIYSINISYLIYIFFSLIFFVSLILLI